MPTPYSADLRERVLLADEAGLPPAARHDGVAGIAGREQHLQRRIPSPCLVGELAAGSIPGSWSCSSRSAIPSWP